MKKNILLSTIVAGLLTSSLNAGTVSLESITGTGTGYSTVGDAPAVTFDTKLALNGRLDLAVPAASGKTICYTPSVEISEKYELTFKAVNGAFEKTTAWKLVSTGHKTNGAAASKNADDAVIATVTDYILNADGTGYNEMTLTVNAGVQIDADEVVTLTKDSASDGAYTLAVAQGATTDFTVAVPKVKSDTGVEKNAPKASAYTVLKKGDTLTATFADKNNVIDVNTQRLQLTVNGGAAGLVAEGTLTVSVGTADKKYNLTGTMADDKYTLTMSGDMSGITGMTLPSGAAFTIDSVAGTATLSSAQNIDDLTTGQLLTVTVDGKTTLNTRTFDLSVVIDDVNDAENNPNVTTDKQDLGTLAKAMTWDINGYQAQVRNFANKPGTKTSVVTLFNSNSLDAELTADILMDDGTVIPTISLDNVLSNKKAVVTGAMLDEKSGDKLGTKSYTVQFTMTVPNADGDAVAFQETTKGSRVLPVIDNTAATDAN